MGVVNNCYLRALRDRQGVEACERCTGAGNAVSTVFRVAEEPETRGNTASEFARDICRVYQYPRSPGHIMQAENLTEMCMRFSSNRIGPGRDTRAIRNIIAPR